MAKETKSKKYTGVYIRVLEDKSKTFYIVYKDPITKKTQRLKIGNSKDGFNEAYSHSVRSEIISKLRLGNDPNIPIVKKKTKQTTLNDISIKYFEYRAINGVKSSIKNTQYKYDKFYKEDIGSTPLSHITKQSIVNFQKKLLKDGYANATINNMINLGSTIFNYAIKEELHNSINPFTKVKRSSVSNDRQRFLSRSEVEQLKNETKEDQVLYLFVLLAVSTGARLDSILSIKKKDIDLTTNAINIQDFKNKDFYTSALIDEVKELIIESLRSLKKDDYIVSYDKGQKMDKLRIQRRLSPILNKLFNKGLKESDTANRVVIHTLRHTFASLLAMNGTPIYTIQKLMNHKDIKQTIRYSKLSPESGINAVQNVFN